MILNQSLVAADGFEKHLINRKRKRNWGMKAAGFTLMLTSMVDMFSMLVVFLLQTFSSSPEMLNGPFSNLFSVCSFFLGF